MQQVEIHIRGEIARDWSDWLGDLRITYNQQGETVLTGSIPDQAALRGVLERLADLGLELVQVAVTRGMATGDPSRVESRQPTIGRIT